MKICIGIILIFLFVLIGYALSFKYNDRKNFYTDFFNFNSKLKDEIEFRQTVLNDIINNLNNNGYFYSELQSYLKFPQNYTVTCTFLNDEEKNEVINYFKTIGTGERTSQIKYLDFISKIIENKKNNTTAEYNKYKPLFIKMGFLFGLIIFIIVI